MAKFKSNIMVNLFSKIQNHSDITGLDCYAVLDVSAGRRARLTFRLSSTI